MKNEWETSKLGGGMTGALFFFLKKEGGWGDYEAMEGSNVSVNCQSSEESCVWKAAPV